MTMTKILHSWEALGGEETRCHKCPIQRRPRTIPRHGWPYEYSDDGIVWVSDCPPCKPESATLGEPTP